MCVGFISVAAELCLLSLLLIGVGLALVGLFWCGLCLFLGPCVIPWRVLQLVTLSGFRNFLAPVSWLLLQWTFVVVGLAVSWYTTWFSTLCLRSLPLAGSATFLAPVCWPTPAVEPCCWVGGVFGASLGSLPCAVRFLRGLQFVQLTLQQVPLGIFCLSCYPGGVGCPATLPFFLLCFCSGWLAGVRWVLHPVSGCSSWGCVFCLGDNIITLLAFPYLRVGELLDCGVYGVS